MSGPRVLLMRLSIRESAKGTEYLSGFLGAARVVAFRAEETDRYGNLQWLVYVSEPDRDQRREQPPRGQSTWDARRDLPEGETRVHRNQRRDPRQERTDAARFDERGPDEEIPF